MTRQINVFVENRPGRLRRVTALLRDAQINIIAVLIQDRGDYGMVKLLLNDPEKAQATLKEAGLAAAQKDILAVVVEHRPGTLCALTECLDDNNINVADAYGFIVEPGRKAVLCVEVENLEDATRIVTEQGFRVLGEDELYDL